METALLPDTGGINDAADFSDYALGGDAFLLHNGLQRSAVDRPR